MITKAVSSPLGLLTLASDGEALTGLWLPGQSHEEGPAGTCPVLERAETWLYRYFAGEAPVIDFPLAPSGTAFQIKVWDILREIPYGETRTYGALAKALGLGSLGARAVGTAVGRNPISILIPCHRVLGAGGKLTGYAGGLPAKQFLLNLERQTQ